MAVDKKTCVMYKCICLVHKIYTMYQCIYLHTYVCVYIIHLYICDQNIHTCTPWTGAWVCHQVGSVGVHLPIKIRKLVFVVHVYMQ